MTGAETTTTTIHHAEIDREIVEGPEIETIDEGVEREVTVQGMKIHVIKIAEEEMGRLIRKSGEELIVAIRSQRGSLTFLRERYVFRSICPTPKLTGVLRYRNHPRQQARRLKRRKLQD